jgi:hypothetical protein
MMCFIIFSPHTYLPIVSQVLAAKKSTSLNIPEFRIAPSTKTKNCFIHNSHRRICCVENRRNIVVVYFVFTSNSHSVVKLFLGTDKSYFEWPQFIGSIERSSCSFIANKVASSTRECAFHQYILIFTAYFSRIKKIWKNLLLEKIIQDLRCYDRRSDEAHFLMKMNSKLLYTSEFFPKMKIKKSKNVTC